MKLLRLLLFIALFSVSQLFAQRTTVFGKVVNKENTPLMWAVVSLNTPQDSTTITSTNTDENGDFIIQQPPGKYLLSVELMGYTPHYQFITLDDTPLALGLINVNEEAIVLDDFVIDAPDVAVRQKGDTTQYAADQYKTNPDATAEDLIGKMPGVTTENGTVKAQGEEVKKVLVDGKPFFGDDPKAALKNIPAQMVDKVQVYDQQSTKARASGYDDGEEEKTINIVTKPEFRTGTFGKVYAGIGYEDKYNAGGVLNIFNDSRRITLIGHSNNINEQNFSLADLSGVASSGGRGRRYGSGADGFLVSQQGGITTTNAFGINYSEKFGEKVDLTASYFFNHNKNTNQSTLSRQYFTEKTDGQLYDENSSTNSVNVNHRFQANLEYQATESDFIQFRPNISFQFSDGSSGLLGYTVQNDSLLNGTDNMFTSDLYAFNILNKLDWTHRMKKKGRSFGIDARQQVGVTDAFSQKNITTQYAVLTQNDTIDQTANFDQYKNTYSVDFDYTEPLSEKVNMKLSYEPSWSFNDANKSTYNFNNEASSYSDFDTLLSNISTSRFNTHEFSGDLRYKTQNKKLQLRMGGGYKTATLYADQEFPQTSTVKKTFNNFLPSATIKYTPEDNKGFWLYYRTRTTAPSIEQLQEVIDNSNSLQLSTGNGELIQEYEHRVFAKYASSNVNNNTSFFAMLRGSVTKNYISRSTSIAEDAPLIVNDIILSPGSQLSRPVNLDGYYNLMFFTSFGTPITKLKSNLNLNLSASYTKTPSLINEELNKVNAPVFGIEAVLSSNFSEKLDFTFSTKSSLNYSFNSLSPQLNTNYFNQQTGLRLYWNFWKSLVYRTDFQHQYYAGLNDAFDPSYVLWNMSLGVKFLKEKKGELSLSVFDLLKQNNSLNRNTTESYIQDSETRVLQRYFMLTFRYDIRAFKQNKEQSN